MPLHIGFVYHSNTCQNDTIGSGSIRTKTNDVFIVFLENWVVRREKGGEREREAEPFSFSTMGTRSLQLPQECHVRRSAKHSAKCSVGHGNTI